MKIIKKIKEGNIIEDEKQKEEQYYNLLSFFYLNELKR